MGFTMNFRNVVLTVFMVVMGAAAALNFGFSAAHLLKGLVSYGDLIYGVGLPLAFISALVTGTRANGFSWAIIARSLVVAFMVSMVGFLPAILTLSILWAAVINVAVGVVFGGVLGSTKLPESAS
jgi:hypothetical protein